MSDERYEYVPPTEWKTLNALEGFGSNSIPRSGALAGRSLQVAFAGGRTITYEFADADRLSWSDGDGTSGDEAYAAREVLDDVFLVDFQLAAQPERAVVLVIDLPRSIVTSVTSTVGDGEIAVEETVEHGALPGATEGDRHERTDAMVGHRVQYVYDADHAYEHIYLNDSTYCWHCLAGAEKGQADAEPTLAYEIRPEVYLFCWRERVVPCDGIVVIDWVNDRNNGRIFGFDTEEKAYNSIRMGARAVRLNETEYAPLAD
jgi:MoaF C-terminal domain/MoaF N-terminal domain